MEYWSWRLFAIFLALQIVRLIRRDGVRNLLRSMRLWGEGVSVEVFTFAVNKTEI